MSLIVKQLLDNSCFEFKILNSARFCNWSDEKFHAVGELDVIGKEPLQEHIPALQPVFKAIRDIKALVLTSFTSYLLNRSLPHCKL
jgi:hypothetical protein